MENPNEINTIPVNENTRKPEEQSTGSLSKEEESTSGIRGGGTSPETFNKETTIEINSAGDVASLNDEENFTNEPEADDTQPSRLNRDEYKDPNI